MDDELIEALEAELDLKVHRQMAYQGDPDCTSNMCRRFFGERDAPSVCAGWHCANCRQPSSQYGHPEGECPSG